MATFNRRKAKRSAGLLSRTGRLNKRGLQAQMQVDEEGHPASPLPRRRGIFLLPNTFTTANLFCGFFAIVMAMNLRFDLASIAIFAAMLLDSVDGRVARLTNTQSEFGAQYDSLSDMLSFGAAPALVVYEWSLRGMGKLGWLAAFVYCAGAALRLARFNTNIGVVDKRYFQGLPSPASAALVIVDAVNAVSPAREQWLKLAERHAAEIRFIEVVCSDAALHEQRLAARAERLAAASLPESFAVEQSLDEWGEWTGASGAIARITLDSVEPLGVNVERALAFLQR